LSALLGPSTRNPARSRPTHEVSSQDFIANPAPILAGCESHIVPLRPAQTVEIWVEDDPTVPTTEPATNALAATETAPATLPTVASSEPATAPGTAPATEPATAAATQPADQAQPTTRPGHHVTRTIDPNQTARYIYNAGYDNVWKQGMAILTEAGFALDRQDYRLGTMTTQPLPSNQIIEFWKPQTTNATNLMENTINDQRRFVRLTISKVEGKPQFYEIAVQVIVERETNPEEIIYGPVFAEGSGFGRNAISLRSDYATTAYSPTKVDPGRWNILGHDPDLERKLLEALFKRI
jgi:hypothetical protein